MKSVLFLLFVRIIVAKESDVHLYRRLAADHNANPGTSFLMGVNSQSDRSAGAIAKTSYMPPGRPPPTGSFAVQCGRFRPCAAMPPSLPPPPPVVVQNGKVIPYQPQVPYGQPMLPRPPFNPQFMQPPFQPPPMQYPRPGPPQFNQPVFNYYQPQYPQPQFRPNSLSKNSRHSKNRNRSGKRRRLNGLRRKIKHSRKHNSNNDNHDHNI
jgi:hypothetical protein